MIDVDFPGIKLYNQLINQSAGIKTNTIIHTAMQYIESNLGNKISIPELANLCATSEATLRRNFKSTIGMSPVEYLNRIKIQKSKQLLKLPEVTVGSICEQLDFYDTSYFYKLFKRMTGMTPMQYRKIL